MPYFFGSYGSSRWLKVLCHYPYQEVDIISPPLESGLALSVEPTGCCRTARSSSRPSLSEDSTFCFFLLGVLVLGTLPLGTQLPCWERPKPHTHRESCSQYWQPRGGAILDIPAQSHPRWHHVQQKQPSEGLSTREPQSHKREQNVLSCYDGAIALEQ